MAKRCVFCGKNLSFFDDKTLLCGNALQRVCTACWAELQDLAQEERAHRALDTGRAEEPEVIQAYLDRLEQTRQAQARAREALKTDKRCLRCGGVMERPGTGCSPPGSRWTCCAAPTAAGRSSSCPIRRIRRKSPKPRRSRWSVPYAGPDTVPSSTAPTAP